ncbi:MAG TPA: hypothetical protein VGW77_09595 [Candidatus Binatia bacterium]|nr:hypothetical protein [Candidatus Binatia bacterium]
MKGWTNGVVEEQRCTGTAALWTRAARDGELRMGLTANLNCTLPFLILNGIGTKHKS